MILRKITIFLILAFIVCNGFAQDETPLIGETKTIQTTLCRLNVTANERSRINKIYVPPAGWQILTFKPVIISKTNGASYAFSQTPANFTYTSISSIYSKFIELLELAAEKNVFQKYEAQINQMRNDFEKYSTKTISTYSKIITTGSVIGNKTYRDTKGAQLYLDLQITLVYMPATQEQLLQSLEYMKHIISTEG